MRFGLATGATAHATAAGSAPARQPKATRKEEQAAVAAGWSPKQAVMAAFAQAGNEAADAAKVAVESR